MGRILELHWCAGTRQRSSLLDVRISNLIVFEDEMGSGRLAGMQKVHNNARKWKLFEFLEEVVDPTGIRYAFMRCNVFRTIPSLSKRKKWSKNYLISPKTVAANCIAYSNYICKHLGFKKNTWTCMRNAIGSMRLG